jgi:hypothetical protein
MTNTDVSALAHGVGELGKTPMLAGDGERSSSLTALMHRHHLSSA